MAASLDGRIVVDGWPESVAAAVRAEYELVHDSYEADGWICGRVTMEPFARFDFGTAVPNNFVFSANGRYLYGSSYYTGASNIFRYDLETQKLDAVTNAETGFFRPIPLEEADSLIVFRYTGNGFVPTR